MSDNPVDALLSSAPELVNSPGLAADSLSAGGDPTQTGQVLSHAATLSTVAQASNKHGGGLWDTISGFVSNDIVNPVEQAAGWVGKELNKPIEEVQHQYRYLHAVAQQHGVGAMLLGALPSVVGGLVGGALGSLTDEVTGPFGTAFGAKLGGEGGGWLSHALGYDYGDLWKQTADGANYRDSDGALVSPGRDLSRLVDSVLGGVSGGSLGLDSTSSDLVSGIGDATFDLSLDPTMIAGKGLESARLAKYGIDVSNPEVAKGVAAASDAVKAGKAQGLLPHQIDTPADRVWEVIQNNPRAGAMADKLAGMSTEQIVNDLPQLKGLAAPLGEADSRQAVAQVFREALTAKNGTVLSRGLPTTSLTKVPIALTAARNAVLNAGSKIALDADGNPIQLLDGENNILRDANGNVRYAESANPVIRALTTYRAFNISDDLTKLSSHEADPTEDGFADTLYSMVKQHMNARTANAYRAQFQAATTARERMNLVANAYTDLFRSLGVADGDEQLTRWRGDVQQMLDGASDRAKYMLGPDGSPVFVEGQNGEASNLGLLINQTGNVTLPNYQAIREIQRANRDPNIFSKLQNMGGRIDDWVNQNYTTRVFKSLALLSLGFALRVSAGELLPAFIQNGSAATRGIAGMAMDKLNPSMNEFLRDNAPTLVGKTAEDATGQVGKIDWISNDGSRVTLGDADGNQWSNSAKNLTLHHDEINDYDLRSLAKSQGFNFDGGDFKNMVQSTRAAIYGYAAPLVNPKAMESAMLTQMQTNGHRVVGALAADHGDMRIVSGQARLQQELQKLQMMGGPAGKVLGNDYTTYFGRDDVHPMFWNHALNEARQDPAFRVGASGYLASLDAGMSDDEALQNFIKQDKKAVAADPQYKQKLAAATDANAFSAARGTGLQGLITGQDGTVHRGVLEDIVNNESSSINKLSQVPIESRPIVKGRVLDPAPVDPGDGTLLNQMVQNGYKRVLDPIINNLSRKPIFNALTAQEYERMYGFVDAGLMSKADANMVAMQRATQQMLPLIHNTELRSQFSELMRNYVPFYFAQEQAYRRWGNAALTDPVAFERFRLTYHAMHNSGIIQTDGAGQQHVVLPLVGNSGTWLTKAAGLLGIGIDGGLPSDISGSVSSLKTVIPENQIGFSPLASMALKDVEKVFPSTEPGIAQLIGPIAQNQSLTSSLIPNSAIRTFLEGTALADQSQAFHSAFLYAMQNAARRADELRAQVPLNPGETVQQAIESGRLNSDQIAKLQEARNYLPDQSDPEFTAHKQEAISRIKTSTRITFLTKALFNMASPLAPHVDVGDIQLRDELSNDIKATGKNGQPVSFQLGLQNFLDKHPTATADTVFQSDSAKSGTAVPAGKAALDYIDANRDFVRNHPLAAAYLLPQDGTTDLEAYNNEVALNVRQRRTPDDFLNALYSASTNAKYYQELAAKKDLVDKTQDPYMKRQIESAWSAYKQQLGAVNPIWYEQLTSSTAGNVAHDALQELRGALSGDHPDSPQASAIQNLISDYDGFAQIEATKKAQGLSTRDLNTSWDNYLTTVAKQNPLATAVINGVFRRLPKYEYAVNQ